MPTFAGTISRRARLPTSENNMPLPVKVTGFSEEADRDGKRGGLHLSVSQRDPNKGGNPAPIK